LLLAMNGSVARPIVGTRLASRQGGAAIADSGQSPLADVRTAAGSVPPLSAGPERIGFSDWNAPLIDDWMPLGTNVVTDGSIHFVDPDALGICTGSTVSCRTERRFGQFGRSAACAGWG